MSDNEKEIDVDELLAAIEKPSGDERSVDEITEGDSKDTTPQENIKNVSESKQSINPVIQEYEINWNGKKIKAPVDKILQWASQGYDYPQKMEQFKKQRTDFDSEKKQWEEVQKKYKPVEEYIAKDPRWWDHVQQSYQSKVLGIPEDAPYSAAMRTIQEKLQSYDEFIQSQKAQAEEAKQKELQVKTQEEDKALETEIESIKKQHPDLDFDAVDEAGKSLLLKVIEHGVQNNIHSFRAAFRDFNHDLLLEKAKGQAKEVVAKETQKRTKLGLIGESSTPRMKQVGRAENIKTKTYEDLLAEVKQEYGLG